MSQFVVLAIVAVIALVLWRRFFPPPDQSKEGNKPLRRDAKTLERDPSTGVYQQTERERQPSRDRNA
jgi:membrane protein implicated in regulation of membrane protease activity